jgi:hypothetical protein
LKALLAKFMPYKGIGLYIGEREIAVSKVARTPLGNVELESHSQSYEPEQFADVVGELLAKVEAGGKHPYPVAVGIPARRVFYSTRPLPTGKESGSAESVLREVMQSPNVCIDELAVQVVKGRYAKRSLASVASCRRDYLLDLLEVLQQAGVQPFRTEPAPLALLRSANDKRRIRKSRPALRLFLGDGEALAVAVAGPVCVFWKSFKLVAGNEQAALRAAIRSCQTLIGRFGIDAPLDVALVHGREDLREVLTGEAFSKQVGVPVVWCSEPGLTGSSAAYGLALGCVQEQPGDAINLTQSMTPQPTIWQIFPWSEVSVQVALVLCMALFLFGHARHVQQAVVPVNLELAKRAWAANKSQADLNKEQRELLQQVEAVKKFVSTRVRWTEYTHDVAERLPEKSTLTLFQGMCELEDGGKKPKKLFTVRAEAPIDSNGTMPTQVDDFLTSLRGDPLLKRDFPNVELTDIKTTQPARKEESATAIFTVLCVPKATAAPAPKAAAAGGHK